MKPSEKMRHIAVIGLILTLVLFFIGVICGKMYCTLAAIFLSVFWVGGLICEAVDIIVKELKKR